MKKKSITQEEFPLKIVGSTIFGRYPKVSSEQTYNMIISDDWLVPYSGYKKVIDVTDFGLSPPAEARAIFTSIKLNKLIVVINQSAYAISYGGSIVRLGDLTSISGTVYVAENSVGQILFCDNNSNVMWLYDYSSTAVWNTIFLNFIPSYISFQDGYFIAAVKNSPQWRLSAIGDATTWPDLYIGGFQTKPDVVKACIPLPGRGGQLFIMGDSCTESWVDVGASLFPYQKNTGYNIDYGCISTDTISYGENIVVWLAGNKGSGATLMYSSGGEANQISTDGINFKFSSLKYPESSYGFLFKQDGHIFYQLTFTKDNYSLVYDFNTGKFFNVTDHNGNYHIAKNIALYDNKYYFISHSDGSLYELSSYYTTYDGSEIPRVRITNSIRFPDSSGFVVNNLTIPIEQGENQDLARVDLSISRDGGVSFGNSFGINFNDYAKRKNKLVLWNLGYANEFVAKLDFWGTSRFVAHDGVVGIFK